MAENNSNETIKINLGIELKLLLEAIFLKYGYDFRNYSKAHLKRRVASALGKNKLENISQLQHQMLYNEEVFQSLLFDLSVNVTEMFRDPLFYKALQEKIFPLLNTYPYLKIWHAGCASGEEVYSMAILLKEEKLYERSQIYATDFNQAILKKAAEGIYPIDKVKEYTDNYNKAGGANSFSDYYYAAYTSVKLDKSLKKNIVFSDHNLVTDGIFGDMNVIICRNVLIYFNKVLQDKVISFFYESLVPGGFLCLGSKESLAGFECAQCFEVIDERQKIFRKKY